ncbi:hypothetical protein Tco_0981692, partial [Tanacetum coccineum]
MDNVRPRGSCSPIKRVIQRSCCRIMQWWIVVALAKNWHKAYLSDYEDFNGGFVAFGSDPKGDELKFNLFSVSQMCDKKNSVLFTESECLILSPSFKLLDESQVVLRAPRKMMFDELGINGLFSFCRCDNGTEFKNYAMNEFCAKKGIKREFRDKNPSVIVVERYSKRQIPALISFVLLLSQSTVIKNLGKWVLKRWQGKRVGKTPVEIIGVLLAGKKVFG